MRLSSSWSVAAHAACFGPTTAAPRRFINSIHFLCRMIYTIAYGDNSRKRQCQKYCSPSVLPSGIFSELLYWGRNSLEELLWDINSLHSLSKTHFQPPALQRSSTTAFCGFTVKITALFCTEGLSPRSYLLLLAEIPVNIHSENAASMVRQTEVRVGKVKPYCDVRKRRAVKKKVVGEKGFPPQRAQSTVQKGEQGSPMCPPYQRSTPFKG